MVAVGGVAAVRSTRPPDPPAALTVPSAALTVPSPTPPSRAPAAPEVSSPSPVARYGRVVDTTDDAPARNREPAQLPRRGEGTLTIADSADNDPRPEVVSLVHRGDWVTLSGRGYLRVTWQVPFQVRAGGIVPPTWSGLKGELFHVASGGGHRRDDRVPGEPADSNFLGNPRQGRSVLPDGAQQFWVHEFYHLDGEVTLTQRESGGDYNLYVHLVDRQTIIDDLNTAPADTARSGTA